MVVGLAVLGTATVTTSQARAATSVVVDGNARFQVLTPTVVRMEYAGDARFQDAPTFNAIKREWPETSFTTTVTPATCRANMVFWRSAGLGRLPCSSSFGISRG
jgi:hypothetical protein